MVCTEVCSLFKIPGEGEILVIFVDWAKSMDTLARDKVMRANIEVVETVVRAVECMPLVKLKLCELILELKCVAMYMKV